MFKKNLRNALAAASVTALTVGQAMAAATPVDTTAATDGIAAVQVGMLAVIGAFTLYKITVWGAARVGKFFKGG